MLAKYVLFRDFGYVRHTHKTILEFTLFGDPSMEHRTRAGGVTSRVVWEDGRPVSGATVAVSFALSTVSSAGNYKLMLDPGSYRVGASHPDAFLPPPGHPFHATVEELRTEDITVGHEQWVTAPDLKLIRLPDGNQNPRREIKEQYGDPKDSTR